MSTDSISWSQLPNDLLNSIAKRIQLMEDFVAFRGVCVSWRAAASRDCFNRSLPKLPILMLAEKGDSDDREFFSLSRGKMWCKMSLPEAKGKKCLESKGWLITVGNKGEVHLLHPFSRVQIELPDLSPTMGYDVEMFDECPYESILLAELSCSPFQSSDYVLMIAGGARAIDFWRPGDKVWTRVDFRTTCLFSDITFFNGQFYVATHMGEIWICDISNPRVPHMRMITKIDNKRLYSYKKAYLVELSGELWVVFRNGFDAEEDDNGEYYYGATHFDAVHLDINKSEGRWTIVKSFGNMSVFVGRNSSFSVDSKCFEGSMIKSNCICFTDDADEAHYHISHGGGKDMGIYHLEDEKIERFQDFQSFSKISPPLFISPYF